MRTCCISTGLKNRQNLICVVCGRSVPTCDQSSTFHVCHLEFTVVVSFVPEFVRRNGVFHSGRYLTGIDLSEAYPFATFTILFLRIIHADTLFRGCCTALSCDYEQIAAVDVAPHWHRASAAKWVQHDNNL